MGTITGDLASLVAGNDRHRHRQYNHHHQTKYTKVASGSARTYLPQSYLRFTIIIFSYDSYMPQFYNCHISFMFIFSIILLYKLNATQRNSAMHIKLGYMGTYENRCDTKLLSNPVWENVKRFTRIILQLKEFSEILLSLFCLPSCILNFESQYKSVIGANFTF